MLLEAPVEGFDLLLTRGSVSAGVGLEVLLSTGEARGVERVSSRARRSGMVRGASVQCL